MVVPYILIKNCFEIAVQETIYHEFVKMHFMNGVNRHRRAIYAYRDELAPKFLTYQLDFYLIRRSEKGDFHTIAYHDFLSTARLESIKFLLLN